MLWFRLGRYIAIEKTKIRLYNIFWKKFCLEKDVNR